jgi:hypothetical protein
MARAMGIDAFHLIKPAYLNNLFHQTEADINNEIQFKVIIYPTKKGHLIDGVKFVTTQLITYLINHVGLSEVATRR